MQTERFVIAPREQCQSCHCASGPTFAITDPRDTLSILRSNPLLDNEERARVEANINYAQSEVELLDEEISRIQRTLQTLQQRREVLIRFGKLEKAILSPIRKLPAEILQHIFMLANGAEYMSSYNINKFPRIAISQVCFHWRSVARSCTPLWTNINVRMDDEQEDSDICLYGEYVEDCLRLSKRMPLTVDLDDNVTLQVLGNGREISLGENAYRWRAMIIKEENLAVAVFASIPKGTSLDQLESLELHNIRNGLHIPQAPKLRHLFVSGRYMTDINITIDNAPSLEKLTLQSIWRPIRFHGAFDSSNITKLRIFDIMLRPDEIISILESMPNLVIFVFCGPCPFMTSTRLVLLPCLEILDVGDREVDDLAAGMIMDMLITPRLKILYLGDGFVSSSVELARRSKCNLEAFLLTSAAIDARFRTPEFSSVKTLHWKWPFEIDESIRMLTYDGTPSDDIFPGVESLSILGLQEPTIDELWDVDDLIEMLKSRIRPQGTDSKERHYLKAIRLNVLLGDEKISLLTRFIQSEFLKSSGAQMDIWKDGKLHATSSEEWSVLFCQQGMLE